MALLCGPIADRLRRCAITGRWPRHQDIKPAAPENRLRTGEGLPERRCRPTGGGPRANPRLDAVSSASVICERRELERQPGAAAGVVGGVHAPAVGLGDLAHDRQPEPRSGRAAGARRRGRSGRTRATDPRRRSPGRGRAPPGSPRARAPRPDRRAGTVGSICTRCRAGWRSLDPATRAPRAPGTARRRGRKRTPAHEGGRAQRPGDGEIQADVLDLYGSTSVFERSTRSPTRTVSSGSCACAAAMARARSARGQPEPIASASRFAARWSAACAARARRRRRAGAGPGASAPGRPASC